MSVPARGHSSPITNSGGFVTVLVRHVPRLRGSRHLARASTLTHPRERRKNKLRYVASLKSLEGSLRLSPSFFQTIELNGLAGARSVREPGKPVCVESPIASLNAVDTEDKHLFLLGCPGHKQIQQLALQRDTPGLPPSQILLELCLLRHIPEVQQPPDPGNLIQKTGDGLHRGFGCVGQLELGTGCTDLFIGDP